MSRKSRKEVEEDARMRIHDAVYEEQFLRDVLDDYLDELHEDKWFYNPGYIAIVTIGFLALVFLGFAFLVLTK